MRAMERRVLLRKLDKEMRHYRLAAREENPTNDLLRTLRKVLRVPMKEMAEKMGVVESAAFQRLRKSLYGQSFSIETSSSAERDAIKIPVGGYFAESVAGVVGAR